MFPIENVSNTKRSKRSAKKEMRRWCLLLSPNFIPPLSQVYFYKISQQGLSSFPQYYHN